MTRRITWLSFLSCTIRSGGTPAADTAVSQGTYTRGEHITPRIATACPHAGVDNARSIPTVTRLAAAIAVLFVLAACGGESAPQPSAPTPDIGPVVTALCGKDPLTAALKLGYIQDKSPTRAAQVVEAMGDECPARVSQLKAVIGG